MDPDSDDTKNPASGQSDGEGASGWRDVPAVWVRSAVLPGILFLMVLYTMYFAASLIMPIALALLLSLVLTPVVRLMVRAGLPQTLSALVVMLGIAGTMTAGIYALAAPASQWLERAPYELRLLEYKLAWVQEPIDKVREAKERIDDLTSMGEDSGSDGDSDARSAGVSFSLVDNVLSRTPNLVYGTAVMLILLYFILASGDAFVNKIVHVTSAFGDKRRVVETTRRIQRQVARFLGMVAIINIGVGLVVALAMYALGVPNPFLWGVMVGILNFVPYLGVVVSMIVVTFVSVLTFEAPLQMLLPALVILAVNVVEGQFLTPILAGRTLDLSPVAVFLAIAILGWIWGLVGVVIAVPMLATVKLVCEHIEPLRDVAVFLGR